MKVGYIVNQYPKVSHAFIRREILELENQGIQVARYSLRDLGDELVDETDKSEHQKTTFLLSLTNFDIIKTIAKQCLTSPKNAFQSFFLAIQLSFNSEAGVIKHIIYWAEALLLAHYVRKDNVEHLHAHFGTNSAAIALFTSKLCEVPYSFTVHGPEEFDKPKFLKLPEKIEHAKFVVAISSFGRSQLYRLIPSNMWNKIKVVHCGIDSSFFSNEAAIEEATDEQVKTMVCIGRLCEQKGQSLIIDALNLLNLNNIDFKLVLVGDGETRSEIESKINQYSLQDKVQIAGWKSSEEVKRILLNCKFSLLPSFAEGLPVSIMESMGLGKPVVSTYIAGIPELIKHQQNGWLVPAGNVEALADTLTEVLKMDDVQINTMGRAAMQAVKQRHNIETEAAKLKSYFSHPESISTLATKGKQ